jgi:hypothetical protein
MEVRLKQKISIVLFRYFIKSSAVQLTLGKFFTLKQISCLQFQPNLISEKPSTVITLRNTSFITLILKVKTNSPSTTWSSQTSEFSVKIVCPS